MNTSHLNMYFKSIGFFEQFRLSVLFFCQISKYMILRFKNNLDENSLSISNKENLCFT